MVDASGPPADMGNFLGTPKPERVALELKTLQDEKQWPVYVHCFHGQDRTGMVVGMFRVLHDHYAKKEAYAERRRNGFHPLLRGLFKMWKNFEAK